MAEEVLGFNRDDADSILALIDAHDAATSKRGFNKSRLKPPQSPRDPFVVITSTTPANVTINTVRQGDSASQHEQQSVYIEAATGGTFTLTFDNTGSNPQTTGAIAYNASASTVKAALDALSNITSCTVTGSGSYADPWIVTFDDAATNFAQMTYTSSLTPILYAGYRQTETNLGTLGTWSNRDAVLVKVPNSETPSTSTRYHASRTFQLPSGKELYTLATVPSTGSTPTFSGVAATYSTTTTLGAGVTQALTFDGENYDTDAYHDNSTNPTRITIPRTGYYRVTFFFTWTSAGGGIDSFADVKKNGGTALYSTRDPSKRDFWGSFEYLFTATDYIELFATNGNSGNRTVQGQTFWVSLIGT